MDSKKQGLLGGSILILALVTAVGIVYAAYSQSLNINGTATVKSPTWKVKFANLGSVQLTGSATETKAPSINDNETIIGDYKVVITKPGDSATYTFDIVNDGTLNATAKISSITGLSPQCTGTDTDPEKSQKDATNVCKYLTYSWEFPEGAEQDGSVNVNAGKTLTGVKLTLKYADVIPTEELPENDVEISGLNTAIVFTQK